MGISLAVEAVGIKHSGGATVLKDLLAAIDQDDRFEKVSVFCSPRNRRNFAFPASVKIRAVECPLADDNRLYRWFWLRNGLLNDLRTQHADVLLCLGGVGSTAKPMQHVNFIQQSLPFHDDVLRMCSLRERLRMKIVLETTRASCRSSSAVIVQTPAMCRRVAEEFQIPASTIKTILPAVYDLPHSEVYSNQLTPMLSARPGRRLLYVGNQSVYKNVGALIRAMELLNEYIPELQLFLTWPPDHPVCQAKNIKGLGYLHGAALRGAYELATALVLPSFLETVGLPMLEAMNVGTPVLAADRPYAHDICEDAALFFDPLDAQHLAIAVSTILANQRLRQDLISKGQQVIRKRRAEKPYEQMLDIVAAAAFSKISTQSVHT